MYNTSRSKAKSVYICNGCFNHTNEEREKNDYYATEPKATELLLEVEKFNSKIWECACGELHISNVLVENGYTVINSDIIDRCGKIRIVDFLKYNGKWEGDIVTNPPYSLATDFVRKAMEIVLDGCKVAMFLKLTFLESKGRKKLFEKYPFKTLYVSSSRLQCAKSGDFAKYSTSRAIAYGWYVWEKGFTGNPVIKWIN